MWDAAEESVKSAAVSCEGEERGEGRGGEGRRGERETHSGYFSLLSYMYLAYAMMASYCTSHGYFTENTHLVRSLLKEVRLHAVHQ